MYKYNIYRNIYLHIYIYIYIYVISSTIINFPWKLIFYCILINGEITELI